MTWPHDCTRRQEPLANHTSFRIGGPAEWFAQPQSLDELIEVLRAADRLGLPVFVLGGGTNTLASDRGIRGVVVQLGRAFRTIQEASDPDAPFVRVRCGAALLTQRLVTLAARHGWGELERLAGLPGQLGGAVIMNAQEIGRHVEAVRLVAFDGAVQDLTPDQLRFHYRYTAIVPGIVAEVALRFPRVQAEAAAADIHRALSRRNETQEIRLPSAGCAFVNPAGACAGRLIDEAGLKGAKIGGAQISQRHANFIVNVGYATCDHVISLMEHVQRCVEREFGMALQPEVRLLGEVWDRRLGPRP